MVDAVGSAPAVLADMKVRLLSWVPESARRRDLLGSAGRAWELRHGGGSSDLYGLVVKWKTRPT